MKIKIESTLLCTKFIFSREPTEMSAKSTKKNLGRRTNLSHLHKEDNSSIRYYDNPATTKKFWKDAEVFMPENKVPLSLRLDKDIVDFFRENGPRYQSRINAVLRAYVKTHTQRDKFV